MYVCVCVCLSQREFVAIDVGGGVGEQQGDKSYPIK